MDHRKRAVGTGIERAASSRCRSRPGGGNERIWASVIVTPVGITPIRAHNSSLVWGDEFIGKGRRIA